MKTFRFMVALTTLACVGVLASTHARKRQDREKSVNPNAPKLKKILSLFEPMLQVDKKSVCYKIGNEYEPLNNIEKYYDEESVRNFVKVLERGILPKDFNTPFSEFEESMNSEAIAMYNFFMAAIEFDTFYNAACYAKVRFNPGQWAYAYYTALVHRDDTKFALLPAPYEVMSPLYATRQDFNHLYKLKMEQGNVDDWWAVKEGNNYIVYSNYSDNLVLDHEHLLTYLTEDKAFDAYLAFFHSYFPWWADDQFGTIRDLRGEYVFFFYQRLLARYNLERIANGLKQVEEFSWREPFKKKYLPVFSIPMIQRNKNYKVPLHRGEDIEFIESYEQRFLQFLQEGKFTAYNKHIDLNTNEGENFLGDYWQSNKYLFTKTEHRNNHRSYEMIARRILGGIPADDAKYNLLLSPLSFPQTSFRDPMFWRLVKRIVDYMVEFKKEYREPYQPKDLAFPGVQISQLSVDNITTSFDWFDYDFTNGIWYTPDELKTLDTIRYKFRQARLSHNKFCVNLEVNSEIDKKAVVKIFLGPKFDGQNYAKSIEYTWLDFYEADYRLHDLKVGGNSIKICSDDFSAFSKDTPSIPEMKAMIDKGTIPNATHFDFIPNRLMLPKGFQGGFPVRFYIIVYEFEGVPSNADEMVPTRLDNKPFGYPFDRPVDHVSSFDVPNIVWKDCPVFLDGKPYPNLRNTPQEIEAFKREYYEEELF